MSSKIIPEDQFKGQGVDFLLSAALAAIQEEEDRQSMVYSVATAGRCLCGDEDITQGRVFEAIETLLEASVVTNALRRYVTELARRAGLESVTGARHG